MDDEKKNVLNSYELMKNGVNKGGFSIDNTTIGIVATNAKLDKAGCKKVSQMAHNGYQKQYSLYILLMMEILYLLWLREKLKRILPF